MAETTKTDTSRDALRYTLKCRHFNGVQHDTCLAGISYESVKDAGLGRTNRYPCLIYNGTAETTCEKLDRFTPEESRVKAAEMDAAFDEAMKDIREGRCQHCHQPVEKRVQVGKCVYAEPCGHRLGQGRA